MARRAGMTYAAIARLLGVSPTRARYLARRGEMMLACNHARIVRAKLDGTVEL